MKFVMHRKHTLASHMGLAVTFEKGVPTFVPPYMYKEVLAVGGVPEEELTEAELSSGNPNEPADADTRKIELFEAFRKVVLRNVREEFTAGGTPNTSILAIELGWTVSAKERDVAWQEFRSSSAD